MSIAYLVSASSGRSVKDTASVPLNPAIKFDAVRPSRC
jgi:hypothetical protein